MAMIIAEKAADQTYDATSINAQSGRAVAEAVKNFRAVIIPKNSSATCSNLLFGFINISDNTNDYIIFRVKNNGYDTLMGSPTGITISVSNGAVTINNSKSWGLRLYGFFY